MPSFDVVSRTELPEVDNAIQGAMREISTRFDFKGSQCSIERVDEVLTIKADDDLKLKQVQELFVRSAATPDSPPINSAVMEWPDAKVPPGIDPNSPDWIAKSMSRALDKYEQTFDATRKKSDQIDSKI